MVLCSEVRTLRTDHGNVYFGLLAFCETLFASLGNSFSPLR